MHPQISPGALSPGPSSSPVPQWGGGCPIPPPAPGCREPRASAGRGSLAQLLPITGSGLWAQLQPSGRPQGAGLQHAELDPDPCPPQGMLQRSGTRFWYRLPHAGVLGQAWGRAAPAPWAARPGAAGTTGQSLAQRPTTGVLVGRAAGSAARGWSPVGHELTGRAGPGLQLVGGGPGRGPSARAGGAPRTLLWKSSK